MTASTLLRAGLRREEDGADEAREATAFAPKNSFDLILVNIKLPDFWLLRTLRQVVEEDLVWSSPFYSAAAEDGQRGGNMNSGHAGENHLFFKAAGFFEPRLRNASDAGDVAVERADPNGRLPGSEKFGHNLIQHAGEDALPAV